MRPLWPNANNTSPGHQPGEIGGLPMQDQASRLIAFFAVAIALLNAGLHFQREEVVATLFFMGAAILLTLVTSVSVRKKII
jgi:hypothetical protein